MYSAFTGKSCRQLVAEHANADDVEREAVQVAQQRRAEADSGVLTVWVGDDLSLIEDHGSVVVFLGTDEQERLIRFAVDHRIARDLAAHLKTEGEVPCSVEPWQVLSATSPVVV